MTEDPIIRIVDRWRLVLLAAVTAAAAVLVLVVR